MGKELPYGSSFLMYKNKKVTGLCSRDFIILILLLLTVLHNVVLRRLLLLRISRLLRVGRLLGPAALSVGVLIYRTCVDLLHRLLSGLGITVDHIQKYRAALIVIRNEHRHLIDDLFGEVRIMRHLHLADLIAHNIRCIEQHICYLAV